MTDDTAQPAAAPAFTPKIVNFDAGEKFDGETISLVRPFQLGGIIYSTVTLRIPTGADYERYTKADSKPDTFGMLTAFTGLPVAALQTMCSADARALDFALGKLLWG